MDFRKLLGEAFNEVVRFIASMFFYVIAPLRWPRTWPIQAREPSTPPSADSTAESRFLYFVSLIFLILAVSSWFDVYLDDPRPGAQRQPDAEDRFERVARHLFSGSTTNPEVIGCILGALAGSAFLVAWLRRSQDELTIVAVAIANFYFSLVGWILFDRLGLMAIALDPIA
jgi:hypothetical protein